jgi:hypothetical protein
MLAPGRHPRSVAIVVDALRGGWRGPATGAVGSLDGPATGKSDFLPDARLFPVSTCHVAIVDYATVVGIASTGALRLQAHLTAAMGRHVLSDVAVIFGLEHTLESESPSRLGQKAEELRELLLKRPAILDARLLSPESIEKAAVDYEPQARALSSYFLMSLPARFLTMRSAKIGALVSSIAMKPLLPFQTRPRFVIETMADDVLQERGRYKEEQG